MIERKNTLEWRQSLKPGDTVMIISYGYNERSVAVRKVIKANKVYITLEGGHEYTVSSGKPKGSSTSRWSSPDGIEPYDKDRVNDIRLEMDIRGYRTLISTRCEDIEKALRSVKSATNTITTLTELQKAHKCVVDALTVIKQLASPNGDKNEV